MLRTCTLATLSVSAALAIAACGGSNKPKTTAQLGTSGPSSSTGLRQQGLRFSQCMRANGVPNFPDPGSGASGIAISGSGSAAGVRTLTINGVPVSAPAFQAAQRKCRHDLPQGPPVTASQLTRLRAGALAMARCMRAHGVTNFPDPVVSAGPGGHGVSVRIGAAPGSGGINPNSPSFRSAQAACGHFLSVLKGPEPGGKP